MLETMALWLLVLLATALAARTWSTPPKSPLAASLLVLLPVPAGLLLPVAWTDWLCGTEGAVEALTEGLLLGLALRALRHRQPWLALSACLLLLEEIDYGQKLFPIATPDFLLALPSQSDAFNFHNLPGNGLWRLLPVVGLLALSRPPGPLVTRLRLPEFSTEVRLALLALVPLSIATLLLSSPREFNESFELAAVALVVAGWRPARADERRAQSR